MHRQCVPRNTEASALGPQGFGLQGSLGGGGAGDDRDLTSLLVLGVSWCREMEYTFMGFEGTFSFLKSVTRCSAKAYKPVYFQCIQCILYTVHTHSMGRTTLFWSKGPPPYSGSTCIVPTCTGSNGRRPQRPQFVKLFLFSQNAELLV